MDKRGRILGTIRKLMTHQQSAEAIGSAAEAQAFAEKITGLMREYRIAEHELSGATAPDDFSDYGVTAVDLYEVEPGELVPWQALLFSVLAGAHACEVIMVRSIRGRFLVGGRTLDRGVMIALASEIERSIEYLCSGALMVDPAVFLGLRSGSDYRTSYRVGFMQALDERLREQEETATAEAGAMVAISRAVACTSRFLAKVLPGIRQADTIVTTEVTHGDAATQGYEDGQRASLATNHIGTRAPKAAKEIRS